MDMLKNPKTFEEAIQEADERMYTVENFKKQKKKEPVSELLIV